MLTPLWACGYFLFVILKSEQVCIKEVFLKQRFFLFSPCKLRQRYDVLEAYIIFWDVFRDPLTYKKLTSQGNYETL